ncbi:MAG: sugar phosphate isomerase/epimerase [Thermomicrobiales bacterium]|nr:sugar phosphate isomerase/epimerase [Thermomicrobiales bacterium]
MGFRGFGYTVEDMGNPDQLDRQLHVVAEAGFTYAEIDPQYWDVWHNGRVATRNLSRFAEVTERHRDRLRFSMHGPFQVNLFDLSNPELHERLLVAGIEVAAAIGAEVMVYHPGHRTRPPAGANATMFELMERERNALSTAAEIARAAGVAITVENMPGEMGHAYSYAIWPDKLAHQVAMIGHPAVGVCIDFGHLYLASRWYGFDLLERVQELAPLTNHYHVQDLFGVGDIENNAPELGSGDMHLPPGWGAIPFDDLFSATRFPLDPVFNVELWGTRFLPHAESVLTEIRRLAALAPDTAIPASR